MSRAEEKARETYPLRDAEHVYDEKRVIEARGYFIQGYHQAEKDLEIAREEELEYVKYQLELRLPETLDYNGVQVDRDDFINDFIKAMKDE